MHIYIINVILSYKHLLYIEVTYINYFINNFNILFTYLFINKKLYYNSSLFLNKSINLTSIS